MGLLKNININFGLLFGLFLCLVFSFFIGTRDFILPALVLLFVIIAYLLLKGGIKGVFLGAIIGIPTFFVFGNNILQNVPVLTMERLVFACLLCMSAMQAIFSKTRIVKLDEIEKSGLVFLVVLLFSLLVGFDGDDFSKFISDDVTFFIEGYLFPIMSYSYAKRINWKKNDIRMVMNLLLTVGVFLFITAVLQMYLNIEWFIPTYTDVIHSDSRATGTFTNASEFGSVTSVVFILAVKKFLDSNNPVKTMLLSIVVMSILIGVILGETRAPWLGLFVSLIVIFILDTRSRKQILFFSSLGFLAVIFIAPFYLTDELIWGRLFDMVPIYNRLSIWATAANMMINNPFMGVGFGRYAFLEDKVEYLTSFGNISASWAAELSVPHNEFIHIAALTGITGITFYLYFLKQLIKKLKEIILDKNLPEEVKNYASYSIAIFSGHLVNCFLVDVGKFIYINTLIYTVVGITVHLKDKAEVEKSYEFK